MMNNIPSHSICINLISAAIWNMDVRQINNHLGSSQEMPQNYESGPDSVEWTN